MLSLSSSDLGPVSFQNTTRLALSARRKLSASSSLRLDYQLDSIRSSDVSYDYLSGTRQRLRAAWRSKWGSTRLDTRYRLELNNRDDLPTQSFSPRRHTLRAIVRQPLADRLLLKADAAWRSSDYPALGASTGRNEERLRLALRLRYRLDRHWAVESFARRTSNRSSNPLFKYRRDDVYLTLAYTY